MNDRQGPAPRSRISLLDEVVRPPVEDRWTSCGRPVDAESTGSKRGRISSAIGANAANFAARIAM
jgi:hypothetical protein